MAKQTSGKRSRAIMVTLIFFEFQPLQGFSTELKTGKAEYESKCAACHGEDGRGNGPAAPALRAQLPDLRLLTRKNDGVFPAEVLHGVIDGRRTLRAHGNYEMPVWGREMSSGGSDVSTSDRIAAMIEYLKSMQIK